MIGKFRKTNYNPWKKNIGDCAIRAISAGIGMSYVEVCKQLKVSYRKGYGLIRDTGIDLEDIKKVFGEYFDNVVDVNEEIPDDIQKMADDVFRAELDRGIDPWTTGLTLNEFLDLYAGEGTFLVSLMEPKSRDGHIVYANANKGYFVDTYDSGDFTVDAWMRIRKTVPKDSPLHWKYDYENKKFIA